MLELIKQVSIIIHSRERFANTVTSYCMVGDLILNFQRKKFFRSPSIGHTTVYTPSTT